MAEGRTPVGKQSELETQTDRHSRTTLDRQTPNKKELLYQANRELYAYFKGCSSSALKRALLAFISSFNTNMGSIRSMVTLAKTLTTEYCVKQTRRTNMLLQTIEVTLTSRHKIISQIFILNLFVKQTKINN